MSAFDLRVYDVEPGELATLEGVLRDLALPMMPEHGITPIGFWSDRATGKLYQVSRHRDRQAVAENWDRFHADPRWVAGLRERRCERSVVRGVATTLLTGIAGMPPGDASTDIQREEGR